MKLTTITINRSEDGYEPDDTYIVGLKTDDRQEKGISVRESMSPEDVNFGSDLSFVYDIPDLIKLAYFAGLQNEAFIHESHDFTEDEYEAYTNREIEVWHFKAYLDLQSDPAFDLIFEDFNEMKTFSSFLSKYMKSSYPEYNSNYEKINGNTE